MGSWQDEFEAVDEKPAPAGHWSEDFDPSESTESPSEADQIKAIKSELRGESGQPTLDFGGTTLFHAMRHLSNGLGDKIYAGEQAALDVRHDKTGQVTLGDAFSRDQAFNDRLLEASDKAHPFAKWLGNGLGVAGNLAALAYAAPARAVGAAAPTLAQLSRAGMKIGAVLGGVGGFGTDRSRSTLGTLANTGFGAFLGGGAGYAAPYAAEYAGRGAEYLGGMAQDLAGWLKVNSIHPTPLLAEAMEDIPGGAPAVGRELLQRGIGGFTKSGTTAQIEDAFNHATTTANTLAAAHDAAGGSVDIGDALRAAEGDARGLIDRPATEEAGSRLQNLVSRYEQRHGAGNSAPASAFDALQLKRDLGEIGYGARAEFRLNRNPVVGRYGAGIRSFERGVDDALDQELGPEFEQANLLVRRLGGARQAAERAAARTTGNTLLGLTPWLMAAGGFGGGEAAAHATPEAAAAAVAAFLAGKYGAQAGARLLYSPIGGGLNLAGLALRYGAPSMVASPAASEGAAQWAGPLGGTLADLFATNPTFAQDRK